MNLDVLKQISAYWLSRMISEMKNSYNIGVEQSNELHRAYLVQSAEGMMPNIRAKPKGNNRVDEANRLN